MSKSVETGSESRLAHLPVSIFSTVMGLTGLAIAWQKAQSALGAPAAVWQTLAALTSMLFIGLLVLYGIKILRFPAAVAT